MDFNIDRAPLYAVYKELVQEIVKRQPYREYAESELTDMITHFVQQFKMINNAHLLAKFGNTSE